MLKSPEEIMRMLENKSNWIGEYEIIFKKYGNPSDLSASGYMKYNSQNNYNRDAFTTKCLDIFNYKNKCMVSMYP